MITEAVTVDFFMRREHRPELEHEEQFWICVTATAQSPDVQDIKIDLYQTDHPPMRTVYRKAFTPYPLKETREQATLRFPVSRGEHDIAQRKEE